MHMSNEVDDHYMIGRRVQVNGSVGRVVKVIEHIVNLDEDDRDVVFRCEVEVEEDGEKRLINADSSQVEAVL